LTSRSSEVLFDLVHRRAISYDSNSGVTVSNASYDFNLLVSCPWGWYGKAKAEIARILAENGDKQPIVQMTLARGIIGVKTHLNPRSVVQFLRTIFEKNPSAIQHTLKWVPVDLWTNSDIESIKGGVARLRDAIGPNETWRMTVETRRYTTLHKIDIIKKAAELIDRRVDLENPKKIVRIDILGNQAGISVLKPEEIFSVMKPASTLDQ
jgi:tRNA acetyltransferase TAN1